MRWRPGLRDRSDERGERRRRTRSQRRALVRDRARKGLAILPSLLTLGNLVCGFYAIVHVGAVVWSNGQPVPGDSFVVAAYAILLAMVFDMLDGRVARMTQSTSDFGAQLDSLADVVTFGVAPGVMVAMLHAMGRYDGAAPMTSKMAWVFGAAYACAGATRLARFNVETASHDEDAHLVFKGLPSPAAAGVVATLILLQDYLARGSGLALEASELLLRAMPFCALAAGYLMVSKFKYVHVANRYLKGRKPADYLSGAIFAGVLAALFPEVVAAVCFVGFALSGPALALRDAWLAAPSQPPAAPTPSVDGDGADPALEEDELEDEELDDEDDELAAAERADAEAAPLSEPGDGAWRSA